MPTTIAFAKRHSLIIGLVLMFLLTWPFALASAGVIPFRLPSLVNLMYGWGFILASLIMTWVTLGRDKVMELLKRFLIWRVGWNWLLVTLMLLPALMALAVLLNAAVTQTPVDFTNAYARLIFGPSANLPLFILPFLLIDAITNGEEMGWRGYALPRLQGKYNALVSSIIIGIIWGLWHIPRYLAPEAGSSLFPYVIKTTLEAVLYTWLYNNTKGSLLMVSLFHASGNTAGIFLPVLTTLGGGIASTLWMLIALEFIVVLAVVALTGASRLSRSEAKQVQV